MGSLVARAGDHAACHVTTCGRGGSGDLGPRCVVSRQGRELGGVGWSQQRLVTKIQSNEVHRKLHYVHMLQISVRPTVIVFAKALG